jgi:hypothetical protein
MGTFILTWNSNRWDYEPGERERLVTRTLAGYADSDRWSTGSRRSGIAPGDRVFMLKQGHDRGIVAGGHARSQVFTDRHWDDSARSAHYVAIRWEVVLPIDQRIDIVDVRTAVPGVAWDRMQGSGVSVPPTVEADLENLWARHLATIVPVESTPTGLEKVVPGAGVQEWMNDAGRRRAVEARAMAVAREYLTGLGWSVIDVSATRPYDFECTRSKERLLVEVKGTTGDGSVVLLTANEVALAREITNAALVVVSGIKVKGSGTKAKANDGSIRVIDPWKPRLRNLEATAYRYTLPRNRRGSGTGPIGVRS